MEKPVMEGLNMEKFIAVMMGLIGEDKGVEITYTLVRKEEDDKEATA